MNEVGKSLRESLMDWLAMRWTVLRAGVSTPLEVDEAEKHIDPDFKRWVANDPMVTENSASRYWEGEPGYLTRNGYGSLEVGASQDRVGSSDR
jgi:hypothetical protein